MSYLTNQILRVAATIRCNSIESNKNSDSAFNKNMTTDTPLTDALVYPNGTLATNILEHARDMERENNKSRQLAEEMSESNQLLLKEVHYYRRDLSESQVDLNSAVKLMVQFNTLRIQENKSITEEQWAEYCRLYRNYRK